MREPREALPPKGSCDPAGSRAHLAGESLTDVLTDLSNDALIDAIDRNCIGFFQRYGLGPGCELHEEADLTWFVTGILDPLFNGVMAADLAPDRVDARIDDVVAEFQRRRIPLEWSVGARSGPSDLRRRLLGKGFEHTLEVPAMAIDLRQLPDEAPPKGFTFTRARSDGELKECLGIALTTFEIPAAFTPRLLEIEKAMPAEQKTLARHFLGRLHGRPVATAELFTAAGVAGLYFVGTVAEARGRGLGRAVTLAALREAQNMGYRVGVLQATEMGAPVYRRLGFRELYTMGVYLSR